MKNIDRFLHKTRVDELPQLINVLKSTTLEIYTMTKKQISKEWTLS
ncbi:sugar transferase [Geobacillus stearothermophilus]